MSDKALEELYEHVILPQFGIKKADIAWGHHKEIEYDTSAHYFVIGGQKYVLLFKDHGGFTVQELKELVVKDANNLQVIEPTSETNCAPMYRFSLPVPFQYAENVTGYFTLVKF